MQSECADFAQKKDVHKEHLNQAIIISNEERAPLLRRENISAVTLSVTVLQDVLILTLEVVISASVFHIPQYVSTEDATTQPILTKFLKSF